MKKRITAVVLCLVMMFSVNGTSIITASAKERVTVALNGEEISFDVQPQIINGTTYVPIRAVCEKLGADVYWLDFNKECVIVKNDTVLILPTNLKIQGNKPCFLQNTVRGNRITKSKEIELESWPFVDNGRTMMPLRAICEAFGAEVGWKKDSNKNIHKISIVASKSIINTKNADKEFFDKYSKTIIKDYMTEERWVVWGFRLSGSYYYDFFEDYTYSMTHVHYEDNIEEPVGTWSFDGIKLTLYNEEYKEETKYTYLSDLGVFQATESNIMAEQDFADDTGKYYEPVYRPAVLEKVSENYLDDLLDEVSPYFKDCIEAYKFTCNDSFPVEVDWSKELPGSFDGSTSFYLVTSHNKKSEVRALMQKYLSDEIIYKYWSDNNLKEVNGRLYCRNSAKGWLEYDPDIENAEALYMNEDGDLVVAVGEYAGGGITWECFLRNVSFTFRKYSDGYKIVNVR